MPARKPPMSERMSEHLAERAIPSKPVESPPSAAPLWTLDRVAVASAGSRRLGPITLAIRPGITAILGHSGAGKTTLCNLLAGFERPSSGAITAHPPQVADPTGRLPIYWAPHDALWPHLDAHAHLVAVAPRQASMPASAILGALGLAECARSLPSRMSAGERARLTVARALASEAAVLVLDEPFAHVDPSSLPSCWRALLDHCAALGSSLVYATHDPGWVLGCADRVACLRHGEVIGDGAVPEIYERPATREVAACFGEANWFAPGEAADWLDGADAASLQAFSRDGGCVRPERLGIAPDSGGRAVVRDSAFHGALARTTLELAGAEPREFVHRPSRALAAGQRVAARLLALLMLWLASGCAKNDQHTLHFTAVATQLPNDGKVQPSPRGLAVTRAGELLVLDTVGRVLVYTQDGQLARQWRMPAWEVGRPEGIIELHDGRIAVADTHYHRIVFFDHDGKVLDMRGAEGKGPGEFIYPISIEEDPAGNVYVSEYGENDRVQKFAPDGAFICAFGSFGTGTGQFQRPQHICWHEGKIYIADAMNNRVQIYTDAGAYVGVVGEALAPPADVHFPYGLWVAPSGDIWVAEYSGGKVVRLAADGSELGSFGAVGHGDGEFSTPWALVGAPGGAMWVADTGNRRLIRLVPPAPGAAP